MRTLFAMELSVRVDGERIGLVEELRGLVQGVPPGASRRQKQVFFRALSATLLRELPFCTRGIWDFSDDATEARRMFDDYAAVLKTRKGARAEPSMVAHQGPMRSSAAALYCNVTFAWLVVSRSLSAQGLAQACRVPNAGLWTRATFTHLLRLMPNVNPAHVESDVAYVIPGRSHFALTAEDLAGSEFEYLRAIE